MVAGQVTFLGRRHSPEARAKMRGWRAANDHRPRLGVKAPGAGKKGHQTKLNRGTVSRWRARATICLNDGRKFLSATAAAAAYGMVPSMVSRVCSGKRKSTRSLRFEWAS